MIRCYDCGQPIRDEQIVRRTVRTGTSWFKRSSRAHCHNVSLCQACSASREKTTRLRLLALLAVGGSVLTLCICGGLLTSLIPRHPTTHTTVTQEGHPATTAPTLAHELVGTITFIDLSKRQVGVKHDGIPGQLSAGDHCFVVAPDAAVPVDQPWAGVTVGQKVDFVIESRNSQWVITKIKSRQDRTATNHSDSEDAAVQEVLTSLKSQDKVARDRGITTIIHKARNWKPANCTLVAKELASIRDGKYLASRALCEIMAIAKIKVAENCAANWRAAGGDRAWFEVPTAQRKAFESVQEDYRKADQSLQETVQTAHDSLRIVNPTLNKYVEASSGVPLGLRGEDGNASAPLLQADIIHFATMPPSRLRKSLFSSVGQKLENCLRELMIVAPDEPDTLNAIIAILRYYESWSKKGYSAQSFEQQHLIYFIERVGTFGAKAKPALPLLQKMTFDKNTNVKKAAGHALQQVTGN
jgi:Cu/Ag efflux protein CusF